MPEPEKSPWRSAPWWEQIQDRGWAWTRDSSPQPNDKKVLSLPLYSFGMLSGPPTRCRTGPACGRRGSPRDGIHRVDGTSRGVRRDVVGVPLIAPQEVVYGAVIFVRARFGGDADYAAARATVLRIVEVGDDSELLCGSPQSGCRRCSDSPRVRLPCVSVTALSGAPSITNSLLWRTPPLIAKRALSPLSNGRVNCGLPANVTPG